MRWGGCRSALAGLLLLAACAPTLRVARPTPAVVDLGPRARVLSLVRVDDPSVLPLSNDATLDPNDQVIGVDFSGGMASVASQLNAVLGPAHLQFSSSGSTLRVLDDGTGGPAPSAPAAAAQPDSPERVEPTPLTPAASRRSTRTRRRR